jgi:hypothetical protein
MIDPARDHKGRYPAKAADKSGGATSPLCASHNHFIFSHSLKIYY